MDGCSHMHVADCIWRYASGWCLPRLKSLVGHHDWLTCWTNSHLHSRAPRQPAPDYFMSVCGGRRVRVVPWLLAISCFVAALNGPLLWSPWWRKQIFARWLAEQASSGALVVDLSMPTPCIIYWRRVPSPWRNTGKLKTTSYQLAQIRNSLLALPQPPRLDLWATLIIFLQHDECCRTLETCSDHILHHQSQQKDSWTLFDRWRNCGRL